MRQIRKLAIWAIGVSLSMSIVGHASIARAASQHTTVALTNSTIAQYQAGGNVDACVSFIVEVTVTTVISQASAPRTTSLLVSLFFDRFDSCANTDASDFETFTTANFTQNDVSSASLTLPFMASGHAVTLVIDWAAAGTPTRTKFNSSTVGPSGIFHTHGTTSMVDANVTGSITFDGARTDLSVFSTNIFSSFLGDNTLGTVDILKR